MRLLRFLFVITLLGILLAPGNAQTSSAAKKNPPAAAAKTALIDINTATEAELKQLPGIGDAYSAKIVQNRPYRAKNQLVQKKIIPAATYEKIKDQIIAKQGAAPPKK
jgi:DNA uptake protein ComE-like DNA-binding protein